MATVFGEPEGHPIAVAVARIHAELDDLAEVTGWSLTGPDLAHTLTAVSALRNRVAELELRVAAQADRTDLGPDSGAADTGSHWAHQTRQTTRDAKRRLALAQALDRDHEPVRQAMAAGGVSEEQAAVIVKGVDALPVVHRLAAEAHLIGLASEHDPVALRRIAHRVLEVVAPEIAEEHERKALERQETLAEKACRFTIVDDGHGLCHGRFTLPAPVGAMLKQAVLAMNAPKHRHHSGTPKGLGHAFCEYVTRYPLDRLPQAGGVDATVVVTMTLENLLGTSQAPALLDTGDRITAAQARLRSPDHPDGAGREVPAPRRRPREASLRPAPADRDPQPGPALHRGGLRVAGRAVPRPPQHPLEPRRQDRYRRRAAALSAAPLLRPLTEVRDEDHPERTRHLQPHVTSRTFSGTVDLTVFRPDALSSEPSGEVP